MSRLHLSQVSSGYGSTRVLRDVDLKLEPATVVALLGRNGMGKSTLLKTIAGQLPLLSGAREIDGTSVSRPEQAARAGLSFVPDDRGVLPSLTVEENLRLARRKGYKPIVDVAELFPVARERSRVKAGDLSGGQKQQVAIARAIVFGSRLIVVDELSQGLQPSLVRDVLGALRTLAGAGVSTLIVDQSPELPVVYCDRILGMSKGEIVLDRSSSQLRADPSPLEDLLIVS